MGRKYRYTFTKKVYPDYVVFIMRRGKLLTYDNDLMIINYIGYDNDINILDKYKINYLVLDDLDIVDIKKYNDNNYYKYLYIVMLKKVIKNIGNNLVKSSLL